MSLRVCTMPGCQTTAGCKCADATRLHSEKMEYFEENLRLRAERAGDQHRLFQYECEIERLKVINRILYRYLGDDDRSLADDEIHATLEGKG